MSDPNATISPTEARRKSGAYPRPLGEHLAESSQRKAAKAAEQPVRAIVDEVVVKAVGVVLIWWTYSHFEVAILKGDKLYIAIVVGVGVLGLSCLIPTQTKALLAWVGERVPFFKSKAAS